MTNGFHGPRASWERLTAPLRRLDPVLDNFARQHGLEVERDSRNWPNRTLRWGAPIQRLIQIYLEDEKRQTWRLWLCAFENRPTGRYSEQTFLRQGATINEIEETLPALLHEAWNRVSAWKAEDLKPAGPLKAQP